MASLLTEIPDVLDQREIWFTNMQLLGFDTVASEEKYKHPFTRDMFVYINKKGMEVVMHFLFSKLNSHLTYEEFRDCWPVYDKKQEQHFRKTCANWLARIAKEEPISKLPRIVAPLLLSPGGDKFYQFILRFSVHVVRNVCMRDIKSDERHYFIPSFVMASEGVQPHLRDVAMEAMKAHIVRHVGHVTQRLKVASDMHDSWRKYASQLTSEYRAASKEQRELVQKMAVLTEQRTNLNETMGGPAGSLSSQEVLAAKRKAKMKKLRELWQQFEDFEFKTDHQREEVQIVLEQKGARQVISAKDIAFQVSELIFQKCDKEIHEGKVSSAYHMGKLSLLSLIQIWNCALAVLRDQLCNDGLAPLEEESHCLSEELQSHRGHLSNVQNLRVQLLELQGNLSESITQLEAKLQGQKDKYNASSDPDSIALCLPQLSGSFSGLNLLPPSPTSRALSPDRTLMEQLAAISPPLQHDSTPEAIHNISKSVHIATQRALKPKTVSSSIPVRVPQSSVGTTGIATSATHSFDLSCTPNLVTAPTQQDEPTLVASTAVKVRSKSLADKGRRGKRSTRKPQGPEISSLKGRAFPDLSELPSSIHSPLVASGLSSPALNCSSKATLQAASFQEGACTLQRTPAPHMKADKMYNLLADQIATEVATETAGDHSPSPQVQEQLHSLLNPLAALDSDAFVSKDKVSRTPCKKVTKQSLHSPCNVEAVPTMEVGIQGQVPVKEGNATVQAQSSFAGSDGPVMDRCSPQLISDGPVMDRCSPQLISGSILTPVLMHSGVVPLVSDTPKTPHLPSTNTAGMIALESPSLLVSPFSLSLAASPLLTVTPHVMATPAGALSAGPDASPGGLVVMATPLSAGPDASPGRLVVMATTLSAGPDASPGRLVVMATPLSAGPDASPGGLVATLSSAQPTECTIESNLGQMPEPQVGLASGRMDNLQGPVCSTTTLSACADLLSFNSPKLVTVKQEASLIDFGTPVNSVNSNLFQMVSPAENKTPSQNVLDCSFHPKTSFESTCINRGMFDSDDGSSLLASLSSSSSIASQSELQD